MSVLKQIVDRRAKAGTAAQTAYAALRGAILESMLKPGTRLLADKIAKELNTSKTPVREALRRLQAEGLIVKRGGGLAVPVILDEQLFDIYSTREALEGMAARLAAERVEPVEMAALRTIFSEMKPTNSAVNMKKMRVLRREFFVGLRRAARNPVLTENLRHLRDQVRQFGESTIFNEDRPKEVISVCKKLLAALEKRDADEAEQVIRANRRRTLELRLSMIRRTKILASTT